MAFSGTQQKCRGCEKTVYPVDQLTADGIIFHKTCFRCNQCNRMLKLGDFSSFESVPYCKAHFEQLLKRTGSFKLSFEAGRPSLPKSETHTRFDSTPALLRTAATNTLLPVATPKKLSRVLSHFSGTQEKCVVCSKTVYPVERVSVEGLCYHKTCFRCSYGGCSISPSNYAAFEGCIYCKHHFSQLFKEKGSYNHLAKIPSMIQKKGKPPLVLEVQDDATTTTDAIIYSSSSTSTTTTTTAAAAAAAITSSSSSITTNNTNT